ncbi:MAG: DUF1302 family protein [Nitrospirota bacterium]
MKKKWGLTHQLIIGSCLICAFFFLFYIRDAAASLYSNLSISGLIKNETAYRIERPPSFSKILNIVQLEPRYHVTNRLSISGRIRGFYDAVYDLESIDTISIRKGPTSILIENPTAEQIPGIDIDNVRGVDIYKRDIELKEIYIDYHLRDMDIRMGKQIVRWGVVEGARVTDEINALDFDEVILRDIENRYIPAWMLKMDYYLTDYTLEFLWIPDLEFHEPAPKASAWEQLQFLPGIKRPAQNFKNSETALKVSRFIKGWDISLSYFYTWDDFPTSFRSIQLASIFGDAPDLDFNQRYTRLRIIGSSFSRSVDRVIINGEAAYVRGKFFGTRFKGLLDPEPLNSFGESKKNFLKYALSIDFPLFGWDMSAQYIQQFIPNYDEELIPDRFDTVYGFSMRKRFLHDLLFPQFLIIYFLNDDDFLIRPKIDYLMTDQLKVTFGADILQGDIGDSRPGEFHFIGFFDNNDRIYVEITYGF